MEYNTEQTKKEIETQINREITINTVKKEQFSTIYNLTVDNTIYLCKVREQSIIKNSDILHEQLITNQKLCDMKVKIPRIYDMWFSGNTKYTIMEYIDGIQLNEYLKLKNFDNIILEKLSKSIAKNLEHWHSIDLDDETMSDALLMNKIKFKNTENELKLIPESKYIVERLDQLINSQLLRETIGYTHGDLNGKNIMVSTEGEFLGFVDTDYINVDLIGLDLSDIKYGVFPEYPEAYEIFLASYLEILEAKPENKKVIYDNIVVYNIINKLFYIEEEIKQLMRELKWSNV